MLPLITLFWTFLGVASGRLQTLPTWAPSYTVEGTLQIPYAEITEPFFAYFDAKNSRSRIDYYGGMVTTVQLAGKKTDYGKSYKVAPRTTEKVLNQVTCYLVNGTKGAAVEMQAALPDTTNFKLIKKNVTCDAGLCDMWQNVAVIGQRKNTYTLWVSAVGGTTNGYPVRYEMVGYDSLLGSHYDRYYLTYTEYTPQLLKDKVFDVEKVAPGIKCSGFSGQEDHRVLMNPMMEYVNSYTDHIDPMFNHFKNHHGKKYTDQENHMRKVEFMHNVRFIHSHNRAGRSYTVAMNHMTDWTPAERKALRGRHPGKGYNGGLPFNKDKYSLKDLPSQKDWRLYGAVTPVKDQAVCGSCWSFCTTGTIEGAYFIKTGSLVRLSQQELIDCSWGMGNNGCDGGDDIFAYQWIKKHGLDAEDVYGGGRYLGQDSNCMKTNVSSVVNTLKGYVNVTSGDIQALKLAIANQGPVSVAIDASVRSFSFYANGVYYEPMCGNKPDDLDHAVLAVGYGYIYGQGYWLVKNSWSTYWGNGGYVLMSQRNNNCGVSTNPTFVLL